MLLQRSKQNASINLVADIVLTLQKVQAILMVRLSMHTIGG